MSGDFLDAVLRRIRGELTLDEFISDTALAFNVAKRHRTCCVPGDADVRAYAKQRIRYTESNPVRLVMADALIDHWIGG